MVILVLALIAVLCLGLVSVKMAVREYRRRHFKPSLTQRLAFYDPQHISTSFKSVPISK